MKGNYKLDIKHILLIVYLCIKYISETKMFLICEVGLMLYALFIPTVKKPNMKEN